MSRGIRKSLVGNKFGKLKVISYNGTDKFRNSLWLCQCDCGNTRVEKGTNLTTGKIVSCGKCEKRLSLSPLTEKEIKENELKYIDKSYIGQKFGRLTIQDLFYKKIKYSRVLYAKCKCDCGKEKSIRLACLKNGTILSCGCLKKETFTGNIFNIKDDMLGKKYGRLLVIGYNIKRKKWKCLCDCGNIHYVRGTSLRNGSCKSCGCLKYGKKDTKQKMKKNIVKEVLYDKSL